MTNHYKDSSSHSGRRILCNILLTILVFFSVLISTSVHWGLSQFANLKMDEIVYELTAPLEGTGNGMVGDYLIKCLVPAVAAAVIFAVLVHILRNSSGITRIRRAVLAAGLVLLLVPSVYFINKVKMVSYIRNQFSNSDFIKEHYADPSSVKISFPDKKRNLILIYLESMETAFSDKEHGGGTDINYIPELTQLAIENEDFSGDSEQLNGGYSMPGTTWTIAGMYATTSGLPLRMAVDDNSMSSQESFFPNLTTMGDILEKEGYRQVFVLGSNVVFGGRKVYLKDHGNFEFRDYPYAQETGWIPEDYKVFWGYEDEKLFEFSKETLQELAGGDEPFHLMMLTVDTHMPEGYQCELCDGTYDLPYANSLSCSDKQTAAFIRWVQQQDFYKDTTIVLTGDHPTMAKKIADDVSEDYIRKTYTCIINPAVTPADPSSRRVFTTFDLFPTTLAALGARIRGEKLGLGTNLFSGEATLSEEVGYEQEASELSKNSEYLKKLERFDEKTQKAVDTFARADASEAVLDRENWTITFRTPDLSAYNKTMKMVRVKVWYYKNQEYVHKWQEFELQEDGTWAGVMNASKFQDADTVQFQVYVKQKGTAYVNLGQEQTLQISDSVNESESSPENQLESQSDNK